MKIKYLPNIITIFRIVATFFLMFLDVFSDVFFIVYILAGFTDVLDGFIARKMNNTSECGAKLDSMADLVYYIVMAVKIFPMLLKTLSRMLWCMLGIVLVLRMLSYGMAAVKFGQFASLHTYMNKLTGMTVFLMPFMIQSPIAVIFCTISGMIAIVAVVEELIIHFHNKEYNTNVKTLFWLKRKKENYE